MNKGRYFYYLLLYIFSEHDDLYFEGDIILDEADKELMKGTAKDVEIRRKRNAIHQRKKIWTTREVPYVIAASLGT